MAFSSKFCASAVSISAACSVISCAGLIGREVLAEELRHQAEAHRELVGLPVVHREHAVLVAGEVGELAHVVPHPLIGRVEQVRAVLVHLDAGLRLGFGVRVAADVRAPVDDENTLVQLRRHALGDRQTEESGTDDKEVKTSVGSRVIGSKGIRLRRGPLPESDDKPEGCDRLTIPYRHSSPSSHISTVDHVGTDRLRSIESAAADSVIPEINREHLPDVVHILRRLPCRTDVDAGSRQP